MGELFTTELEMEFDWNNPPFELDSSLTQREIEESFEDPFAIRLLPDSPGLRSRRGFSTWGMSASGDGVFSVYRTNGKQIRVIYCPAVSAGRTVLLSAESGPDLVAVGVAGNRLSQAASLDGN